MGKILYSLFAMIMLFGTTIISYGQIFMDGDSTDWSEYPILTEAPNNEENMFPPEVRATVTDRVDIKYVNAMVIDNILFGYIEFWGGPAWPNYAYENDHEGTIYFESRGYYRLLLDVDNDYYTGWGIDWYEVIYSPVGYLMSSAWHIPIGAEIIFEWRARTKDDWKIINEGADAISELSYRGLDFEEYNGKVDTGSNYLIFDMAIPDADSARAMKWEGSLKIGSSDDELLLNDTLRSYWVGHAWGHSFLEFGMELTPFQKYFMHKDGRNILQPGDVIGLSSMVETPIDDWGIDMTTKGEINIIVGVPNNEPAMVENFSLSHNYPNPFNPSTTIRYSIPTVGNKHAYSLHVQLKLYDILGREVTTLVNKEQKPGNYEVKFDASRLTSGTYYYRIAAGSFVKTMKMIYLK